MSPKNDRLNALLSRGWFPKELPVAFTTADFGSNAQDILLSWEKSSVFSRKSIKQKKLKKRDAYNYSLKSAEPEIISKPKRGHERRNLCITHPIPQALLSYEISENWFKVHRWLSRQLFSIDKISISNSFERSIEDINFDVHHAKKAFIEATADWIVKTDITSFYSSIYTHSVAWAAYGKERVKKNLHAYEGSLADRIDSLVRSCNRNQTVGIPIGPETSRIIAEIISSRIDHDFFKKMKYGQRDFQNIDRLQDDWFVGVDSLENAENLLSVICSAYRPYGLEINGSKTSVDRVVNIADEEWVSEIRAFLSHSSGPISGARLKELFSLGLRLQVQFPRENVIGYVLSAVEGRNLLDADVSLLESFMLKAATASPISLDKICKIILNINYSSKNISIPRITTRFTKLAEKNILNGNTYEAIWLLYAIRGLRTKLKSKTISEAIEVTPSSALALILLDMESKGLVVHKLPKSSWVSLIDADLIRSDWSWLLSYEGVRHGWLPDPKGVMRDPFFAAMHSRDVTFYDPRRNVMPSKKEIMLRKMKKRRATLEAEKFLRLLRGFSHYQ